MALSCDCGEYEPGRDAWGFWFPNKYEAMPETPHERRCCSCNNQIDAGSTVIRFIRYRAPLSEAEQSIYSDEVPLATWWMCEDCADLYWSLDELGYCVTPGDMSMRECVAMAKEL